MERNNSASSCEMVKHSESRTKETAQFIHISVTGQAALLWMVKKNVKEVNKKYSKNPGKSYEGLLSC